ncbi:hypothetical protein [Pararobbsia alpina]|uniref:Uncharacterized protein n=1 Tax=Pararobbsia alpina TaxID=621374 RepID=A0A6S7CKU5_9BURK|nr:hypothetical protein [Pararobbsia alpina]CAB3792236.1 hypothetical protein LMG28138_03298 [Pararobbsia alpina]
MSSIVSTLQHSPNLTPFANSSSPNSSSPNSSSTFDDVSEVELQQITTASGSASVSLGANLSGVSTATGTGQLAVAFASAIQSATTVDPTTGQRELTNGAGDKLTSAITALLVQNGFSTAQAGAAAANLKTELANGDPLTLSMSYDNISQSSLSASGSYGSNATWSAQSVTQTERAGSLNISIDASGTLNVSLKEQTTSTAQYEGEVKGTGTLNAPVVTIALLPGQGNVPGSTALTAGDLGSGSSSSGTPSFVGFGTAAQAAASQFAQDTPDVFKNGFGQASAASPVTESEADTLQQASLTSVLLVNTTVTTPSSGGANGSDGEGNGQGSPDGSQSSTGGQNAGASSNNGVTSGTGSSSASEAATLGAALKSMDDTVSQMLTDLSKTSLVASKDLPKLLEDLLKLANQAQQGAGVNGGTQGAENGAQGQSDAGSPGNTASGYTGDAAGSKVSSGDAHGSKPSGSDSGTPSSQASGNTLSEIEIGFTQTLSIQIVDQNGYGSTMYARPDGSLGSIVRKPTHVTA